MVVCSKYFLIKNIPIIKIYKSKNKDMKKYLKTRRVLSETKAIMSPPYVTGWNQFFCRGR